MITPSSPGIREALGPGALPAAFSAGPRTGSQDAWAGRASGFEPAPSGTAAASPGLSRTLERLRQSGVSLHSGPSQAPPPSGNGSFLDDVTPAGPVNSKTLRGLVTPQNMGRIKHIVMKLGADPIDRVGPVYEKLMTLLPEAQFTFVMQEDDGAFSENREYAALIRRLDQEGRIDRSRIKIHRIGGDLETWFQDSSIVRGDEILAPRRATPRATYQGVLREILAEVHPDLRAGKKLDLFLEGGNKRATGTHVFLGSDVLRTSRPWQAERAGAEGPDRLDAATLQELRGEFPRQELVVLGSPEDDQAVFHVDLGFVPLGKVDPATGKPIVVVGDTGRTFDLLGKLERESAAGLAEVSAKVQRESGCRATVAEAARYMEHDLDNRMGRDLDRMAAQLDSRGYCVKRVPYIGFQGGEKGDPDFPWFAYCNGLIDGDTYLMPSYGIDDLDNEAARVFEESGYQVERIPMGYLSRKAGSLNCMSLVVEREY